MLGLTPFRDATSVHVDADPDQVTELLVHPEVIRALDHRIPADSALEVIEEDERVEVRDLDGHVCLAFRVQAEGSGTRLSAMETVRPSNPVEAGKHMFFPGRHHQELQDEMGRLKGLLEGLRRHGGMDEILRP